MKVTFQIEGATPVMIECNAGDNLLELARRANVAIDPALMFGLWVLELSAYLPPPM